MPVERQDLYCDHNATTPPLPEVLERFLEIERSVPGNPASVHAMGRRARGVLEDARAAIAATFHLDEDAVVFVSGGTEANNLAVRGLGALDRPVLVSAAEHASILEPARLRGCIDGALDERGRPTFTGVASPTTDEGAIPGLVCATWGQSEIGTLPDLDAASALARGVGAPLHVDVAQALGRVPLDSVFSRADSVSVTVHKAGGLRGQGVWILRRAATSDASPFQPLLVGGGHEQGLRPGTPSPALAAATALAIERAVADTSARAFAMRATRDAFEAAMLEQGHAVVGRDDDIDVDAVTRLPNTAMIAFAGIADGRSLLPALDLAGVRASQGSACSSGSSQPAGVLLAMPGFAETDAWACLRFSFGVNDSPEFARDVARIVSSTIASMQRR